MLTIPPRRGRLWKRERGRRREIVGTGAGLPGTHPGDLSGQELAQRLGVSRNGVWRAVNKLKSMGYEIEAGTNRGYRLVSGSGVLSPENIRRQLGELGSSIALEVRDSVDSTNTLVKHLAEQGGREGMVVIAQHQTAGKGRLGRSFYSPKGTGLYLSILLRPKFSAQEALSITTAAAVAVAEAVDQVTGKEGGEAKIKWVNDVYYRYRKVCGILTEASIDFETGGLHYAVLGIGVNLTPPPGGFGPDIAPVAGALFPQAPAPGTKTELAAAILSGFFRYYQELAPAQLHERVPAPVPAHRGGDHLPGGGDFAGGAGHRGGRPGQAPGAAARGRDQSLLRGRGEHQKGLFGQDAGEDL